MFDKRTDIPPFRLETLALHWSTILLCLLVAAAGFVLPVSAGAAGSRAGNLAYILSGIAGLVLTLVVWWFHNIRVMAIKNAATEWEKKTNADQDAVPNGGPMAPFGNSGVTGGATIGELIR